MPIRSRCGDERRGAGEEDVARFAERTLGAPVAGLVFVSRRRALTCGVALADGRRAVVKCHPPDTGAERLRAVQRVQRHLAASGFPCPRPLAGPEPLANGIATAESWLGDGRPAAPFARAEDRAAMAAGLAEIVRRCAPLHGLRALDAALLRPPRQPHVWPEPRDPRLTFAAPAPEAAWIDALGLRARRRRESAFGGPAVVGHGDWHAEHVRLSGGRLSAVYDWDSLMRAPEPFIVGCAVAGFTADWSRHEPPVVPPLATAEAFTDRYEAARGAPLPAAERTTARAHWVEICAYAARLELAREAAGLPVSGRYRAELAEHGARLLGADRARC